MSPGQMVALKTVYIVHRATLVGDCTQIVEDL